MSLIEVIVAAMLIAIAALSALSFLVYCSRLAMRTNLRITAANFARETMEGLYKKDYGSSYLKETKAEGTVIPKDDPLPTGSEFGSKLRDQYGGTRSYTVIDKGDYKIVTVKVNWNQ